jgi:predicted O-methyltransferase YrrM
MFIIFLFILSLLAISVLFLVLKKVIRIDKKIWNLENHLDEALLKQYQQIEALGALKQLLQTKFPLPAPRGWAGSPEFLLVLAQHALKLKPENIVECSSGVSTIVLARCAQLNGNGHVFSLENDPVFAGKTRQHLRDHGLESYATVIDAPLVDVSIDGKDFNWYSLTGLQVLTIDFLVIDGPPAHTDIIARFPAGPLLFNRLTDGAAVFLDDAFRAGEQEIVQRWMKLNPSFIEEVIQCEKGLIKLSK